MLTKLSLQASLRDETLHEVVCGGRASPVAVLREQDVSSRALCDILRWTGQAIRDLSRCCKHIGTFLTFLALTVGEESLTWQTWSDLQLQSECARCPDALLANEGKISLFVIRDRYVDPACLNSNVYELHKMNLL